MTPDPYAFTNSREMGDIVPPQPRTYARFAMLDKDGKIIPIGPQPIELDIWRYVLDAEGQPTSYCKRERMRTLLEVFADLHQALDMLICNKCGHEMPREPGHYGEQHTECGGEYEAFIDEYFSGPTYSDEKAQPVPHDYRWIACYPVTGTNEGWYVHVEFVRQIRGHVTESSGNLRAVTLATGKTFRGMDHAAEIARRCAILLGALTQETPMAASVPWDIHQVQIRQECRSLKRKHNACKVMDWYLRVYPDGEVTLVVLLLHTDGSRTTHCIAL